MEHREEVKPEVKEEVKPELTTEDLKIIKDIISNTTLQVTVKNFDNLKIATQIVAKIENILKLVNKA